MPSTASCSAESDPPLLLALATPSPPHIGGRGDGTVALLVAIAAAVVATAAASRGRLRMGCRVIRGLLSPLLLVFLLLPLLLLVEVEQPTRSLSPEIIGLTRPKTTGGGRGGGATAELATLFARSDGAPPSRVLLLLVRCRFASCEKDDSPCATLVVLARFAAHRASISRRAACLCRMRGNECGFGGIGRSFS